MGFISTAIQTFANLIATTGCHGNMVTMATVKVTCFFTFKERITSKCDELPFLNQNFFSSDLKFFEKLVTMATRKMPIIPLSKKLIS